MIGTAVFAAVVFRVVRFLRSTNDRCSGCDGCPKSKECDETIKKTGNH